MSEIGLKIIDESPIVLSGGHAVEMEFVAQSVECVNNKFRQLREKTIEMSLNIFEVIDFRMLSGLVGESLVSAMSESSTALEKNPNIDGYPDLLNASKPEYSDDIERWKNSDPGMFINYPHHGIEIKNTFGTKKANVDLALGQTRINGINNKLDWKAHHRYTNNLLALVSDYIDECPQIVAVMFSNDLSESDWKEKQNPRENSTMTSFSVIEKSGFNKLKSGIKLCHNDHRYLSFFGLDVTS